MTTSPDLGIVQLSQNQANPDITFNTAFITIQALVNGVIDKDLTAPPGSPAEGDAYLIASGAPTGAWSGHGKTVAIFWGGIWNFVPGLTSAGTPIVPGARNQGLRVYVRDEAKTYTWSGSAWVAGTVAASDVTFTPVGTIAATDVQAAIAEVASEAIQVGSRGANSVIGRSANTVGAAADIVAGTNDRLFAQVSNALSFTQLTAGMVPANTIALAGLVNATAQYNLIGRSTAAAGAWEQKATSADVFSLLGAANFAAINTLLGLGAAALLGVATAAQARAGSSTSVLVTPQNFSDRAKFSANKNGTSQTGVANAVFTKVTFGTTVFDVGSLFDTTNSRYVPPAGKCRLSAAFEISYTPSVGINGIVIISLYKNGSEFLRGARVDSIGAVVTNEFINPVGSWLVDANGTDFYEIYVFANNVNGSGATIGGGITLSYFQGEQT